MANNDHLQRQIEFIVDNQAQFTTDIQELKQLHKEAEKRITKLEDVFVRLGNALVDLADKTTATQTNLDAKMAALAESQAHADQRLSALIDIVMAEKNGKRSA
jgi:septation ring formation regulator EzrA